MVCAIAISVALIFYQLSQGNLDKPEKQSLIERGISILSGILAFIGLMLAAYGILMGVVRAIFPGRSQTHPLAEAEEWEDGADSTPYFPPATADSIRRRVVGVTFKNDDGSSRQAIIKKWCQPRTPVLLKPNPSNRHDGNAVEVWIQTGKGWNQIGHLASEAAQELKLVKPIQGFVTQVSGFDRPNRGVIVEFIPPRS